MGLLDSLTGALGGSLGQVEAAAMPALISAVLAKTNLGDLQGLATQLQQGGLGNQVQSWLGGGGNLPGSPDQLPAPLRNDPVKELAHHFGGSPHPPPHLFSGPPPGPLSPAPPNRP